VNAVRFNASRFNPGSAGLLKAAPGPRRSGLPGLLCRSQLISACRGSATGRSVQQPFRADPRHVLRAGSGPCASKPGDSNPPGPESLLFYSNPAQQVKVC
jgi:hypothetical protein